jgi:hypothetical protein
MNDEQEMITVKVVFTARVRYSQDVKMSRRQFNEINASLDAAEKERGSAVSRCHGEIFDILSFQTGEPDDFDDPELDTLEEKS